jgi:hypothetical protein
MAQHAERIVDAAQSEGAGAAVGAAWDAYTEELQSLPVIRWGRQAVAASNADVSGDACGEAYHRTGLAIDVASDAALIIGAVGAARAPSGMAPRPQSAQQHAPRVQTSSPLPESYINFENIVDMRVAPNSSARTAGGFARNANWFWRQMLREKPQMFDAANQARIRGGSSPVVNAQWVKYNPTHEGFVGETLIHHHVNQGPLASPVPESVHRGWTKSLHPYTRK